jgi:hypothetical protein
MSGGERGRLRRGRDAQDGRQQETRTGAEAAMPRGKGPAAREMNPIARRS